MAAANTADVDPASTVTEDGTVTLALSSLRVTAVAFAAAPLSVTIHVDVPAPDTTFGVQVNFVTDGGGAMTIKSVELLPTPVILAVMVAVTGVSGAPAEAVKIPAGDPGGMVTARGTVTAGLLDDKPTLRPVAGAPADSDTVQLDCVPDGIVSGVQTRPVVTSAGGIVTVPAIPDIEMPAASGVAPSALATVIVAVAKAATLTDAISPSGINVVFRPNAIQVYAPGTELHEIDFPAVVSADPAVTTIFLT